MNSTAQSKENTVTSLAALYPEAFALAMSFYSRSRHPLLRLENAGMNHPTGSEPASWPDGFSSFSQISPN